MTTRRSTAPRKKRPSPHALGEGFAVPTSVQTAGAAQDEPNGSLAGVDELVEEMRHDLMAQIDGALRKDAAFDQQAHEAIMGQFSAAFADALSNANAAVDRDADLATLLEESARQLKEMAASEDGGSGDLVRQLDQALESLERRETKVAFEFSRRLQSDGQESALAWLKKQQQADLKDAATKAQGSPAANPPPRIARDTVTQSKSRRLRGPPRSV